MPPPQEPPASVSASITEPLATSTTSAAPTATASQSPHGYNGTCILGGSACHYANSSDIWPSNDAAGHPPMTGLAGDDPSDPRIAACCAPFPVRFAPPCTLWCEYDPASGATGLTTCLEDKIAGLKIQSSFGQGPGRITGWLGPGVRAGMPTAAVSSAMFIAAGLGITFATVQWRTWRYGKKDIEGWKAAWWASQPGGGDGVVKK